MARSNYSTEVLKLFNGETIAASGSLSSRPIPVADLKSEGGGSIQLTTTGSGTYKVEYIACLDCKEDGSSGTYTEPVTNGDIGSGITAGTVFEKFIIDPAKFIKIVITETGGANSITVAAGYIGIR